MAFEETAVKAAIAAFKEAFRAYKKVSARKEQEKLLSGAIRELLKLSPDITAAEAKILAAEALGQSPSETLLHAKRIAKAVKADRKRKAARKKKPVRRKKVATKKSRRKKTPARKKRVTAGKKKSKRSKMSRNQ